MHRRRSDSRRVGRSGARRGRSSTRLPRARRSTYRAAPAAGPTTTACSKQLAGSPRSSPSGSKNARAVAHYPDTHAQRPPHRHLACSSRAQAAPSRQGPSRRSSSRPRARSPARRCDLRAAQTAPARHQPSAFGVMDVGVAGGRGAARHEPRSFGSRSRWSARPSTCSIDATHAADKRAP